VVRIAPDLALCDDCLRELRDPDARRFAYPYLTCAHCGPRYSIVRAVPYDRSRTTMAEWPLCADCQDEYHSPHDRRFHAESIACSACGPGYELIDGMSFHPVDRDPVTGAAALLRQGGVLAIKGVGGYHLSCDAANEHAVDQLRRRKFRKSRPFALMIRDLDVAGRLIELSSERTALLRSPARPIVLAPARMMLPAIAPGCDELGIMLPYTPIHHLLFDAGAPDALVMTSANVSSEPIAFEDDDARRRLSGIADAFLVGGRAIARRIDDSVIRSTTDGPIILRRGRGYAPAVVARLAAPRPILAVGADLKNTITLVIDGAAVGSQHIGDLEHLGAYEAFCHTIDDLIAIHGINWSEVLVVHDAHPHYASTAHALRLPAAKRLAVQHHRAHIASVLAERGCLDTRVAGVAFDGTGYGDDGTIWGGEFFVGSVSEGFNRVASLRPFALPGGDAAARHPLSAAAGVLADVEDVADLCAPPFSFPARYRNARALRRAGVRTFSSTSSGRLFDAGAALLGFSGANEYEAQAAIWLEQLAASAAPCPPWPFVLEDGNLDFRPAFEALIRARLHGAGVALLARAFHETIAAGIVAMTRRLCDTYALDTVVLSGGAFQNRLLVDRVSSRLLSRARVWINHDVPPNDGGISLGQAALGAASLRS
jgi:hydrogenase maturation protein HypF